MYKKVLVPLDGSGLAECALRHIISLAAEGSLGEVTLLNIVKFDLPWLDDDAKAINLDEIRAPLFAASGKYLAKIEARLRSKGIAVKKETIEANHLADTIIEYARKKKMDLIVLSTHGYSGFKRLMLGSVAFGVMSGSDVPVLLIRPAACRK